MRVLLAMSGGVDSSVVAHMLREQGHDVVGVRFLLWNDPLAPALAQVLASKCCNAETAHRAGAVAKKLGIPLQIIDLSNEFKSNVVDPFLEGYRNGLTPNPCVHCNRTVKFGTLLKIMRDLGCEKLATGHYARVAREELPDGTERMILLEAVDTTKDQSYYLYGLSQEQLQQVLFPLGGMKKQDVLGLARHFDVPLPAAYRESQDLCFFPEKTPHDFLQRYLPDQMKPGRIVRRNGTVVGTHDGLPLYTVGQRRGLRIGGLKVPLEVVAKDVQTNELIVAEKGNEVIHSVEIGEMRFLSWLPEENEETPFQFRTRSLAEKKSGKLVYKGSNGIFHFDDPLSPVAPGQSLVLYRGEELIGGGVMTSERLAAERRAKTPIQHDE